MALGTNEVSLLDLTGAFASARAGRSKVEPWGVTGFGAEGSGMRSLGPPNTISHELQRSAELASLLQGVVEHGTGRAAGLRDDAVAGKTGTSQDHRDAWFIGFNRAVVVGVWVGNDDRTPMKGVTGGSLPAEIWRRFVSAAMPLLDRNMPRFEISQLHGDAPQTAASHRAQCDLDACAAAYRSFRASDCTYQSYGGERRLCRKGMALDRQPASIANGAGRDETRMVGYGAASEENIDIQLYTPAVSEPSSSRPNKRRGSASPPRDASENRSRSWPQVFGGHSNAP